jgi:hypothetical protein
MPAPLALAIEATAPALPAAGDLEASAMFARNEKALMEYRPVSGSAYSALMWAARITLAQVSISTLMRMANSSGVLATGS